MIAFNRSNALAFRVFAARELKKAARDEIAYLKEATGSGRPFMLATADTGSEPVSLAEKQRRLQAVIARHR